MAQDDVDWDIMLPVVAACSGTGVRARRPRVRGMFHTRSAPSRISRTAEAVAWHGSLVRGGNGLQAPVTLPAACLRGAGGLAAVHA
jgi:hypothetical protein